MLELFVRGVAIEKLIQSGQHGKHRGMGPRLQHRGVDRPDQRLRQRAPLDRDLLSRFGRNRVIHEEIGELCDAGVDHGWMGPFSVKRIRIGRGARGRPGSRS